MTDFRKRLAEAAQRGQQAGDRRAEAEARRRTSQKELRRLHSEHRMALSERIETCLRALPDQFPGFRFETIVGPRGWGAAVSRDDIEVDRKRQRKNFFSRLELVVRPISEYFVLDLAVKGTIRNKEILARNYFQRLAEVDLPLFFDLVDRWVLEYAERFAAAE
ncbi:MAG: hypothetical protein JW809_07650 [Pirellulales bacterium]|nr:hypothetical protein [Pirellulales bacterium]